MAHTPKPKKKAVHRLLLTALFCFLAVHLFSQLLPPVHTSLSLLVNTGVQITGTATAALPVNTIDPRWEVSTSGIGSSYTPAVIISPPTNSCLTWSPNQTTPHWSKWITHPSFTCAGTPGGYSCNAVSDLFFRLTINLPANPVFNLDWKLFAATWVQDITVNGGTAFTAGVTSSTFHPVHIQWPLEFRWCRYWLPGVNTIVIHVRTDQSYPSGCKFGGLRVESFGPGSYMSVAGPTFVCAPMQATYTTPSPTAYGYAPGVTATGIWTLGGNWSGASTTTTLGVNFSSAATSSILTVTMYSVYTVGTATNMSCLSPAILSITIPPPLTVTPVSATVCTGKSTTISASGASSYTWQIGSSVVGTGSTLQVSPSVAGATVYTLKGGGSGCVYTKTVLVTGFQTPNVTVAVSPTIACAGANATLQVSGTAQQYSLYPTTLPNPQVFTVAPVVLSKTTTTTFTVVGRSIQGCTNTANATLSIVPIPTVVAVANPSVICSGVGSTLTATGATNYTWVPGPALGATFVVTPAVNTTYTVTGSTGGCVRTNTVKVNANPGPVIVSNPPSICPGITNTLTATGAVNYTWYIGSPATVVANTSMVTITSSLAVSYTVIGIGANTCTGSITGTVPLGAPIPISAPDVTLCTNGGPCTTVAASSTVAGTTFTWLTTPAQVGNAITVCPTVMTIYTVNASSNASGCPSSATLAVSLASACCAQSTIGLTAITGPTMGGSMGNAFGFTSYILDHDITLGASTFLQNAEIWITEDVAITVPSGMQLDLENTHLFGCGIKMWDGIDVLDGGRITTANTRTTNSMIEDAVVAINLDNISVINAGGQPPIDIARVIFNRNYIGIRISNSAPSLTFFPLGINGCVFTSRTLTFTTYNSPVLSWPSSNFVATLMVPLPLRLATSSTTGLAPPYGVLSSFASAFLKYPYDTQPAHTGIQVKNVGTDFMGTVYVPPTIPVGVEIGITYTGSISNDFNLFEGIGTGIDIDESSFTAKNNVFQNLLQYTVSGGGMAGGTGIDHFIDPASQMIARLDLREGGNHFWDCHVGVNGANVHQFWITDALFRSTHDVLTANNALGSTQGDIGVNYESRKFDFTVFSSEFNNLRKGVVFATPQNPTGPLEANFGMMIMDSYFGAEVNSSNPYSGATAASNNTEYMSEAIEVSTPNVPSWIYGTGCVISSNKINRAFRGIALDGWWDESMWISSNEILVEEDQTYAGSSQYGIAVKNNFGQLGVYGNTVQATVPWNVPLPTPTISAFYFNTTSGTFSNFPTQSAGTSPYIGCNTEKDCYYGFHFDGANPNTDWRNNTMCDNFAGLALTSTAVIGPQGSPTQCNNNLWAVCNNMWGTGPAQWQTYCENSDPTQSPLYTWGPPPMGLNPNQNGNGTNSFPVQFYTIPSGALITASGLVPSCPAGYMFNAPPGWRIANNINSTVLMESMGEGDLTIFPNPTNEKLSILGLGPDEQVEVRIFDLSGKLLFDRKEVADQQELDLSELIPSVYLVEIKGVNCRTLRRKLVKIN